jgi:hypothetical protein
MWLWIGSTPGSGRESWPIGQPLVGKRCAGVSSIRSPVVEQPFWNVCQSPGQ